MIRSVALTVTLVSRVIEIRSQTFLTRSRIRSALAVHTNGLGFSLCAARYSMIAFSNAATLRNTPRRICFSATSAKNRSTWFSHDPPVGVK
jgi:hypothetical protein